MCVSIYKYRFVYISIYIYISMYVYLYIYKNLYIYKHTYVYISVPYRHGGGWSKKINAWYLNTLMVYL
jgi:hypothetical protein